MSCFDKSAAGGYSSIAACKMRVKFPLTGKAKAFPKGGQNESHLDEQG